MPAPASRRWPAEWEPQSGVMLTWPHAATDWAPRLSEAEAAFARLAAAVSRYEAVLISCWDPAHMAQVRTRLTAAGAHMGRVHLFNVPSNDSWARDHGPLAVVQAGRWQLLDFKFNGWGGRYPADLDNLITQRLHAAGAFGDTASEPVDMVLEGGSIDSDGQGTILTTTRCLLSQTRNPDLDRAAVSAQLTDLLGARRILWLDHGELAGDDTDGHIDMLARFVDPHTIVYMSCGSDDEHHAPLYAMLEQLRTFTDGAGRPYTLRALPMPAPIYDDTGQRLPASYANFLIINGAVLVPTYDDPADAEALRVLQDCFPDREMVAIPARALIEQHGSVHCVTMQLPAGILARITPENAPSAAC